MIRFFDICFSILGLVFLSPLLLFLSLWIKLNSKGPVLFKQERVGRNEVDFTLFKFRSMRNGANRLGLLTIGEHDSCITRSGRFMRKYKLDELPQLYNVLIGDMSFVGPRPEVRRFLLPDNPNQKLALMVRPGLTDYASIKYLNENLILQQYSDPEKAYFEIIKPDKLDINKEFIQNYTLMNYFKVIFLTVVKIIR
jgi:lipopolysaccharide/colanic/teichoic acid biosynthesis glycosyltransferase